MLPQRTAGSGIAVGTGPIELVATGNYGGDVDWLLEDDGAAKLEANIMRLVRCRYRWERTRRSQSKGQPWQWRVCPASSRSSSGSSKREGGGVWF